MYSQALFFFSALGAFNGLLAGLLMLGFSRSKKLSSYLLGILIVLVSIRIGKSSIYFFQKDISQDFLQLGLVANFLIGPTLYFYLKYLLQDLNRFSRKDWLHISLLLTAVGLGILFPYSSYPALWSRYIWHLVNAQLALYVILAASFLWPQLTKFFRTQQLSSSERWSLLIYGANLLVCLANVIALFTTYILGPLVFSVVFYALLITSLLIERKQRARSVTNKYRQKLSTAECEQLTGLLIQLMEVQKPYKNPALRLQDLASELNTTPHRLSQLLNDNMQSSFSQYINEHRVNEAKSLLKANHNFTLEAIGYDAGFNSKSTFFTTFKKSTGLTPAQYRDKLS